MKFRLKSVLSVLVLFFDILPSEIKGIMSQMCYNLIGYGPRTRQLIDKNESRSLERSQQNNEVKRSGKMDLV